MGDLISRQAAIDAIKKLFLPPYPLEHELAPGVACGVGMAIVCIEYLPEAKIERMTGEWRKLKNGDLFSYCSVCGNEFQHTCRYYYCPHCGAFMGGEQDGSD